MGAAVAGPCTRCHPLEPGQWPERTPQVSAIDVASARVAADTPDKIRHSRSLTACRLGKVSRSC